MDKPSAVSRTNRGRGLRPPRKGPQPSAGAVPADGEDDPDRGEVHDERGAAVAEEGERDTRQRQQPEVAAYGDDGLDGHENRQAAADQRPVRGTRRPAGQRESPHDDDRGKYRTGARDQSPLPDQAGQGQVGLPLGQPLSPAGGGAGRRSGRTVSRSPPRCAPAAPPSPSRSTGTRGHRQGNCRAARPGTAAADRSPAAPRRPPPRPAATGTARGHPPNGPASTRRGRQAASSCSGPAGAG